MLFFLSALIVLQVASVVVSDEKYVLRHRHYQSLTGLSARENTTGCPAYVYQWTSGNFLELIIPSVR
jgi:hypothetical protein